MNTSNLCACFCVPNLASVRLLMDGSQPKSYVMGQLPKKAHGRSLSDVGSEDTGVSSGESEDTDTDLDDKIRQNYENH